MAPVPGDSSKYQFGTSMPQGGHPPHHSITSSARASSVGGTSRPSALAVLRLITSSNFVGCSTREIGGLGAFENLADIDAHLAISLREAWCVTHQAAGRRVLAPRVDRGYCVTGGQGDDLIAPVDVIPILAHDERIDPG